MTGPTWCRSPPRTAVTHVRLTIHPDGGVARLRVFGEVVPDPRRLGGRVDLAATWTGGRVEACSDMFFSRPANALAPGRAQVMSDGWETARRRDDGHDWLVVRLAVPGVLHHAVIDTTRFAGNAPGRARLSDERDRQGTAAADPADPGTWHWFRIGDGEKRAWSAGHLSRRRRSRLRLAGMVPPDAASRSSRRWLGLLPRAWPPASTKVSSSTDRHRPGAPVTT